jgi:alcohol dehydrogenase class IV
MERYSEATMSNTRSSSINRFEFATAARIVFGAGRISDSGKIAAGLGNKALVVTGRNPARCTPLMESLTEAGVTHATWPVEGEPSISDVERGVEAGRRQGCNLVVAMGGGSAIDCGKAIAAMLTNPGGLLDYLEIIGAGKPLPNRSVPFIAIPTTSGTGSEVTRNAVLASPEHKVKVSLRSAGMLPDVALLDPALTLNLPPDLTASTGMDALTQVLEPCVCLKATPLTDLFSKEGLRLAGRSLRKAWAEGANLQAREDMALASLYGGLALANAGLGAVHGFAGSIGGMFSAPHGAVCAVLLPHVMEANILALNSRDPQAPALARYTEVARILTGDPGASAQDGAAWVRGLVRDLQIPALASYGIKSGHAHEIVSKARRASSMKPNPVELSEEELTQILRRAL